VPIAATLLDESTERLSHKEVEQRRREKAKLYFDELRALLPCGADSKFDKNTILRTFLPTGVIEVSATYMTACVHV
jgi:hypothetical protein